MNISEALKPIRVLGFAFSYMATFMVGAIGGGNNDPHGEQAAWAYSIGAAICFGIVYFACKFEISKRASEVTTQKESDAKP